MQEQNQNQNKTKSTKLGWAAFFRTRVVLYRILVVFTEHEMIITRNTLTANSITYKTIMQWDYG